MWRRVLVVDLILIALLPGGSIDADTTICHKVEGRGNTGNGYNLITVNDRQLERHRQHPGDIIPAINGFCFSLATTTTTQPTHPPTTPPPHTSPSTTHPTVTTVVPATSPPTTRPLPPTASSTTLPLLTGTLPPSR